jgi:sporulation protein YlmC with PRC-barrel domain
MTRTESDLLGLEVVSLEDSSVVGQVDGLLIDAGRNAVVGLVLDAGIYEANAVAFADLRGVDDAAVWVEPGAVVTALSRHPSLAAIAERDIRVVGEVVLDDRGDVVGVVRTFSVDTTDGTLVSLEVGPEDANSGDSYTLPMDDVIRIGSELVLTRSACAAGTVDL